jgi:hypothetical protein
MPVTSHVCSVLGGGECKVYVCCYVLLAVGSSLFSSVRFSLVDHFVLYVLYHVFCGGVMLAPA